MKCFLSFWAFVLVVHFVQSAEAGDAQKEAKAAFKEGVALFENESYEAAAAAFRRANALKPAWSLLFNIGQCEAAAKRYGIAYEVFEAYLAKGGDDVSEARRKEVVAELDRLAKMIGSVAVEAPDGAVVWIDGVERGTVPLPGKLQIAVSVVHSVEIVLDGQTIHEENVKVIRGESVKVSTLKNDGTGGAIPQRDDDAASDSDLQSTGSSMEESGEKMGTKELIGWIAVGTGGAFLIGGGVTGGLALARNKELSERCDGKVCSPGDKDYAMGRDLLALSSNILFGIGGAAAVTGIVLLILSKRERKNADDEDVAAFTVAPVASSGFAGLSIVGRF